MAVDDKPNISFNPLVGHEDHELKEVAPCVYCVPCGVRLYQGRLPKDHPNRPPSCGQYDHDWDWESSQGFYGNCTKCGARDWGEWNTPEESAELYPSERTPE